MNDTITAPTVRVEFGHQITWPNGHVEHKRDENRDSADASVTFVNRFGRKDGKTAIVVTRTVTTTPWTQV